MSMEDIFAEAVERLERGEPLDEILASYPEAVRAELAALLLVVEDVIDLALEAAPTPSPVRRLDARTQFMQTIVEMKAAHTPVAVAPEPAPAPIAPPVAPPPKSLPPPQPSLLDKLRTWLQGWQETPFGAFAFNLAPLAALLLAAYLATAWMASTAQAAVPGDPAYRIKEWARETNTELATPEERSELQRRNDAEIQREMELVATRAANLESVAPRSTLRLQFRGMDGRIFLIGPLRVLPNYQPDRQADIVEALTIEGDLQVGVPVELEYQILPGNPGLVQGIAIRVLGAPEPTPEQIATPTIVPTNDGTGCQVMVIPGWEPLAIFPGMKVTDIASRAGISIFDLMAVNCLEEQVFTSRGMILVPENYYIKVTPTSMPTAAPPVYRPPAAPTATPTRRPTRTPAPTATAPEESTPDATATGEMPDAPTATPTDAPVDPSAPIIEPTATPTQAATDAPTDAPTAVPTAGATDSPTAAPTAEATAEPTAEPTAAPTEAPTEAPSATPTQESSDAAEEAPTAAINARPTATAEEVATATKAPPTPEPPPTATRTPPTATPEPRPTDPPPRPTDPPPPPPTDPPPPPPEPTSPPPDAGGEGGGGEGGEGGNNPASGASFQRQPDAA